MKKNQGQPKKKQLKTLEKQKLRDMEHRISRNVSAFFVLLEEGSADEVTQARQKARADLLKWGSEMQAISRTLGGDYPECVKGFIDNVDTVLHCPTEFVDQEKMTRCYHAQHDLEKML